MSPKLSKPLSPGDVITQDMPIIHIIHNESKGKYCDNCVQRSDQLKRCSKCLHMYYCSKECQKNDWKYHKNECSLLRHRIPELLLSDTWFRLWFRFYLSVKKIPTFATEKHRLVDGSEVSLNDLKSYIIKTIENKFTFESICKLFTQLAVSYGREELEEWFPFMSNSSWYGIQCGRSGHVETVATGLYLEMSTLKHSCRPNTSFISKYNGHGIELRAMRSIAPGEEITISFVNLLQNKADRQRALQRKSVDCECEKCVANTDRNVDYRRLQPDYINDPVVPDRSSGELETYYRSLLADLDVVYGDYHPFKTLTLVTYVVSLRDNPLASDSLRKEIRDMTAKALNVTNCKDCPFWTYFKNNHY